MLTHLSANEGVPTMQFDVQFQVSDKGVKPINVQWSRNLVTTPLHIK